MHLSSKQTRRVGDVGLVTYFRHFFAIIYHLMRNMHDFPHVLDSVLFVGCCSFLPYLCFLIFLIGEAITQERCDVLCKCKEQARLIDFSGN